MEYKSVLTRNVVIIYVTTFIVGIVGAFTSWFLPIYVEAVGGLRKLIFSRFYGLNIIRVY